MTTHDENEIKHNENELKQLQIFLDDINNILEQKLDNFDGNSHDVMSKETMNEILQENMLLEKSISLLESKHGDILSSFKKIRKTQEKYQLLYYDTFQKYHDLYEYSPIMYRSADSSGNIINCNITYAKKLGYAKNEILSMSIFDHVSENSIHTMKELFEEWKKSGRIKPRKIWMKKKDGSIFPAMLESKTIFSQDGALVGSHTAIQDITQIHNMTQEIEEVNERLKNELEKTEKLNRVKDEFMTMITHELKTPLVPIKGYSDLLIQEKFGSLSEEQKTRIALIQNSAEQLMSLITDLLDAQKIELGEFKIQLNKTNISNLIGDLIKEMSLFSNSIKFDTSIEPNVSCMCDENRIKQVLTNIIKNAMDFVPKNNGVIKILLKQTLDDILIAISDNGVGLSDQEKNKIFQKFYQSDLSMTRKHGGTGLGLSISKGIVESHNGTITVESEGKNKGTTFNIILPK